MNTTEITVEEILWEDDVYNVDWSDGAITDICINYVDGEESDQSHIVSDSNGGMQILDTEGEPIWTLNQIVHGENLAEVLDRKTTEKGDN